jgi:predicted cupin superfamily sugar epimerase
MYNNDMEKPQLSVEQIIQTLNLQPLIGEGGLYTETYRSTLNIPGDVLPESYAGRPKPAGTAIFYLLTNQPDSFSAFHRLPGDEIYHFYLGDPLELILLFPDGSSQHVLLGQDLLHNQHLQFVVPANAWQGSRVAPGGKYSLVGTTMAPGFTPEDFQSGQRERLLAQYPQERDAILALTRS